MPAANSSQPASSVRRPRLRLLAGGEVVSGCVEASVISNSHLAADTWSATIALGPDPARGADWWSDAADADPEIEVQFAFLPERAAEGSAPWQTFVVGTVDDVDLDLERSLVQVRGRDLTSRLIESQTTETNSNLRASELARKIAARHGLQADVDDTPTLIGQYYQREHAATSAPAFSRATTDWDILTSLAGREGFEVAIERRTLVFRPAADPERDTPFLISWTPGVVTSGPAAGTATTTSPTCAVADLQMRRSLGLARSIEVTVQSRNARTGENVKVTVRGASRAQGGAATSPGKSGSARKRGSAAPDSELDEFLADKGLTRESAGFSADEATSSGRSSRPRRAAAPMAATPDRVDPSVARYVLTRPNLSREDALQLAQSTLAERTKHERLISFSMPGELAMTARTLLRLSGTGTAFDQDYYVDEIDRTLSFEGGFIQRVRAKNSSPRQTTAIE